MKLVVAPGGNALLRRDQPPTADNQLEKLATGHRAVIGSLDQIDQMIAGTAGTQVCTEAAGGADTL